MVGYESIVLLWPLVKSIVEVSPPLSYKVFLKIFSYLLKNVLGYIGIEFAWALSGLKNYRDNWFPSVMSRNEFQSIRGKIHIDFERVFFGCLVLMILDFKAIPKVSYQVLSTFFKVLH
jgi:hypothetical protein